MLPETHREMLHLGGIKEATAIQESKFGKCISSISFGRRLWCSRDNLHGRMSGLQSTQGSILSAS
jgi:hypothetical protein